MPEVGSASLAIIPSFKNFGSSLENGTAKHMAAAGASGGSQFGDAAARSGGARFKAGMAKAAKVAAAGLAIGIAGAIKFGGDALAEAREAQKVGALTESTIKATGKAAKVTAAQVGDLSGAISRKSGIDDEVIQSGANMLLTFKNIRNEAGKGNKIFNRTTKATADMAAAMAGGSGGEIDLKSASILLGKALNDPVKGLTALTRVGVTFSDKQKAINKALVEGGDLNALAAFGIKVTATEFAKLQKDNNATYEETVQLLTGPLSKAQQKLYDHYVEGGHAIEAQKNILKELNSEFGGAAKAQATEADKLKVAWGNFKEEIGTQLLPVMDDLSRFLRKKGIPALQDFGDWVRGTGIPKAKEFAGHIKDIGGFLNDLPRSIKIGGLGALAALTVGSKLRSGSGTLGTVGRVAGLAAPVKTFETNPAALGSGTGAAGAAKATGKVATILSKGVLPVAVVAWSGMALKDFFDWNHKDDKNPVEHALTGGNVGRAVDKWLDPDKEARALERAEAAYKGINDATKKLPNQLDQGKTAAQNLYGEIFKIGKSDPKVNYTAPGFDELLRKTREYDSLLDGLNRTVVTHFVRTTTRNNDTGEGGGGVVPGRSPREGGVTVNIERVAPNNYNDFMTEIDRRTRNYSLDGVR